MRLERRILRLNDEIARLESERVLVDQELAYHRHLNDDAARDAAVSENPIDRAEARGTAQDVARFERSLSAIDQKLQRLRGKRDRMVERLG